MCVCVVWEMYACVYGRAMEKDGSRRVCCECLTYNYTVWWTGVKEANRWCRLTYYTSIPAKSLFILLFFIREYLTVYGVEYILMEKHIHTHLVWHFQSTILTLNLNIIHTQWKICTNKIFVVPFNLMIYRVKTAI